MTQNQTVASAQTERGPAVAERGLTDSRPLARLLLFPGSASGLAVTRQAARSSETPAQTWSCVHATLVSRSIRFSPAVDA
jgi:hypothetical protein